MPLPVKHLYTHHMPLGSKLELPSRPDAYGIYRGTLAVGQGVRVSVEVVPPQAEWRGLEIRQGYTPASQCWRVFVDGALFKEVAKLSQL